MFICLDLGILYNIFLMLYCNYCINKNLQVSNTYVDMIKKIRFPKKDLNFTYTFCGGQAFRWKQKDSAEWIGVFANRVWTVWQDEDNLYYTSVRKGVEEASKDSLDEDESLLRHYFRLDEPLGELYNKWVKMDNNLKSAADKFNGVRMLQQDPIEIIFTFICSSCNTITRITSMVDKLCNIYGEEIAEVDNVKYHGFPKVEKLADPSVEKKLQNAAFGYRSKFIQQSANKIVELGGDAWIQKLVNLPYKDAKKELMILPGIGAKVADCICLMSLNHLEAIPVDTHVFQIGKRYLPHLRSVKSVTEKVYNEIGDHFRSLYGQYAGWPHCTKNSENTECGKRKKSPSAKPTKKGRGK